MLLGKSALERLSAARVAVFGIGGVGGYVVEVLARSGVGAIDIIDKDVVDVTNINRQIIALHSTVGQPKVEVARRRILDINPACCVFAYEAFYLPENADTFDFTQYDYVVDCVDNVTAKIDIICRCQALHVPLLSCMGAANKMDATAFRVADISQTNMDPLAKIIRKKLRKLGITHQQVVYSEEMPLTPVETRFNAQIRPIPASNAFVPAAAGLLAGSEVVKRLI